MTNTSKVALIIGASRGLGKATAEALAREGWKVAIAAKSMDEANPKLPQQFRTTLRDVAWEIKTIGGSVFAIEADIIAHCSPGKPLGNMRDQIDNVFTQTKEHFGQVDAVVYCPGALITRPTWMLKPEELWLMTRINLIAPGLMMEAAVRHMPEGGGIVFIAPRLHLEAVPGAGAYLATKSAQVTFAEELNKLQKRLIAGAIWSEHILYTAATEAFVTEVKRHPVVTADAVATWLTLSPEQIRSHTVDWSDEELLLTYGGLTHEDLSKYDVVSGSNPPPLSGEMVRNGVAVAAPYFIRR